MIRKGIAVCAIIGLVLLAAACRRATSAVDLVAQFDAATKQPAAGKFAVEEVELNGERKRAIAVPPDSRLTFKVQVPDEGWLRVSVGTKPESWTQEGDGSYFLVGVSDNRTFDDLFTQHVNPFANGGDRKWIEVWVDLSAYAGEEVELKFNTRTGPPKREGNARGDAPLWGDPEIVIR
jgi:hypothetical protein